MKSARRRSRELALQGLYAWQMARGHADDIVAQLSQARSFAEADREYFERLLRGTIGEVETLRKTIVPALDRKWEELSPVERGILLLAAFELQSSPDVPFRVIINEAVEIAKVFGGTEGHKYVNGVLDRVAKLVRPKECAT